MKKLAVVAFIYFSLSSMTMVTAETIAKDSTEKQHESSSIGLHYRLEGIKIRGNKRTVRRAILRHVPFQIGEEISVDDRRIELLRFRLLGTGFFSEVNLSLNRGSSRGRVNLIIDVIERNTIVVNELWLGLSADATPNGTARPLTAFGGVDVAETNLFGTGMLLGGAIAVADRQQGYRLQFADSSFLGSRFHLGAKLLYNNAREFYGIRDVRVERPTDATPETDSAVTSYERTGIEAVFGIDSGQSSRMRSTLHVETIESNLPKAASYRRGLDVTPIDFHLISGRSWLTYLSLSYEDDTRDDPVLPKQGHFAQVTADAGLSFLASDYSFLRIQGRYSFWNKVRYGQSTEHTLRLDFMAGAIFGNAPIFMRYFVGDLSDFLPDRVLDLNFDRRSSPNFFRNTIDEMRYEEFEAKISTEYRIPLYRGSRSIFGIDFFASAGIFTLFSQRDLRLPARGYRGLQKIPLDVNMNLGIRIHSAGGAFMFGISNLIGFFPLRRGAGP